jgi:hypothetical protein
MNGCEEFGFVWFTHMERKIVTTVQQKAMCVILYAVDTLHLIPYSDMLDLLAVSEIRVQVCLLWFFSNMMDSIIGCKRWATF